MSFCQISIFQILEPREPQSGCFRSNAKQPQGEVLSNYNSDYYPPPMSYVTPLQTIDKHEHDEVRKPGRGVELGEDRGTGPPNF